MTQQANIGLPNRPFRISNVSSSANICEDDQYMANLIDQHLALSSSGRSRKVSTISQPILTEDISLFNNAGFLPHQIRRSETSYPYAYKPSGNLQAKSGVQLRNTSTCTDDFHEELPININHLRRQQTKGIKKTIKSISKTRVLDPCAQSMESAVQLDHCQRLAAPHPIRYKISENIQPSTGTILRTHYAMIQEEPAQELSIHLSQLRVPLFATSNTTNQSVSSIIEPTTFVDLPIMNETPFHIDRVQRLTTPQVIQYKPSTTIQPSIGSIFQTRLALGREDSPEEKSFHINQLRHPAMKHSSTNERVWAWM